MRQKRVRLAAGVAVVAIASVVATTAFAGGGREVREELTGEEEVPVVLTDADGKFKAKLFSDRIEYTLRYEDFEGEVTQAHIHIGQRLANGNIAAFLCSNLGNGPPGTPPCPPDPGTVTDEITASEVVATAASQGIGPGELDELIDAIRDGWTYANVHSTLSPAGEARGQLNDDRDGDD
jgi:CHRD domain-containing protein